MTGDPDPRAMTPYLRNIVVDCADPERLARFWAAALGYERAGIDDPTLFNPATTYPRIQFLRVPEPKAVKNRLHLDLGAADRDAVVARLIDLGARELAVHDEDGDRFTVMADPEGNEFCVVAVSEPDRRLT